MKASNSFVWGFNRPRRAAFRIRNVAREKSGFSVGPFPFLKGEVVVRVQTKSGVGQRLGNQANERVRMGIKLKAAFLAGLFGGVSALAAIVPMDNTFTGRSSINGWHAFMVPPKATATPLVSYSNGAGPRWDYWNGDDAVPQIARERAESNAVVAAGGTITGDGLLADGALRFNAVDGIKGNEYIAFELDGTMETGETITFGFNAFNQADYGFMVQGQLWDLTTSNELAVSEWVSVLANSKPDYKPCGGTVSYTATGVDSGHHLAVVFREWGNKSKRDPCIDNIHVTSSACRKKARPARHPGVALRQHGDDGVHTYRIPGLVTTTNGTLIAVYDIRHDNAKDLQGNIDIGMSRSTDGGKTWEPMKAVMDMGEWGGLPEDQNGIGDPSILVDCSNNTIWVAGLWAHGIPGQRVIQASEPGLDPKQSAQWMLVKSEDDGKTWSKPINITKQVKNPAWKIVFQGPGKGICMGNGILVFPAQFWDGNNVSFSTIIWSKDHGVSWHCGTGAKSDTTEAQVIELDDGSLMLNMRDNRNRKDKSATNGRSVAVTTDLGETWTEHPTSRGALPEPVCMASLIKDNFLVGGKMKSIVLFSNPNSKFQRERMTIKASVDDARSWPESYWVLLDAGTGRGYSCMTKIDDSTVGILYEGSKADLVFQTLEIDELFGNRE